MRTQLSLCMTDSGSWSIAKPTHLQNGLIMGGTPHGRQHPVQHCGLGGAPGLRIQPPPVLEKLHAQSTCQCYTLKWRGESSRITALAAHQASGSSRRQCLRNYAYDELDSGHAGTNHIFKGLLVTCGAAVTR